MLKGWKQAEVVKYTIDCRSIGYTAGFYVAMNLDRWNALPKDIQKVLEEVSAEWIPKHGEAWDESDKAGIEFSKGLGNEVIELSKEENARWAEVVAPVKDIYIEATDKRGLPGNKFVDFVTEAVKKHSM